MTDSNDDGRTRRPPRPRPAGGRPASARPARGDKPFRARPSDGDWPPRRPGPSGDDRPRRARFTGEERLQDAGPAPTAPVERVEAAEERIAKVIARAGVASRRDAEALIEQGRVTLNGETVTSPALNVTEADRIAVDGEPLPAKERSRLWLYHKPRGLVTTARDPQGRPTVFEQLPEDLPRVVTVGRLDINTEGLLLLTNDGGLAKVVAHPDTGWLRRYKVRAHGAVTQDRLDALRGGITIDEVSYGPVEARIDREQGDNLWLTIGLREGKNREIKRILEHLGLQVNRLIRLSFGPFQLGELEPGQVEEVRTKVLREQLGATLAAQAGVDFESPVREPIAPFGKPGAARQAEPARERGPHRDDRGPRRDERGRDSRERPAGRRDDRRFGEDRGRPREEAAPARKELPRGAARRSVWRDETAASDASRGRKIPRRGLDPKEAREKVAGRARERVGAIETGERKVLVERLKAEPRPERPSRGRRSDAPGGEERPRRPPPRDARPPRADRGAEDRPRRPGGRFEGRADARFEARTEAGGRPRRDRAEAPGGRPPRSDRAPRQDAPPRARSERGPARERGAGPGRTGDRRPDSRLEGGFGRGSGRGPGTGPGPGKGPGRGPGRGPGSGGPGKGPRGGAGKGPPRGRDR